MLHKRAINFNIIDSWQMKWVIVSVWLIYLQFMNKLLQYIYLRIQFIKKASMSQWHQFSRSPHFQYERKPSKDISKHLRHRLKLQQWQGNKPQNKQKQGQKNKENPWDMIGKALTQRYNKKFMQLSLQMEKRQKQSIDNADDGLKECKNTPKFQIKRKYLSFDYKGRESREFKSSLKFTLGDTDKFDNDRLMNNHSSVDSYQNKIKTKKHSQRKKIKQLFIKDEKVKTEETSQGTFFIPNFTNISPRQNNSGRQNYKCIYIKKNRKRVCLNPELQVSEKKTKPRKNTEQECIVTKIRERIQTDIPFSRKRKKQQIIDDTLEMKTNDKVFRPWSGYESDDNL